MPKKRDNFTPLFWDFSRLLGEMILNFVEELLAEGSAIIVDQILNEFWSIVHSYFTGTYHENQESGKLGIDAHLASLRKKIRFITHIYLSTLFDFINEAKSGLKDLRRAEVMQDYFYCQILFLFFYTKFQNEYVYKRLFAAKLAMKFYEYATSGESVLQSLINSLEKFYFEFSNTQAKNKQQQIGPVVGTRSPFMGLSYFQEKDKEFFFGRELFTIELLKAIENKPIVALAGASGSGKSSVVHAGVIPELREKNFIIHKFRSGANPYSSALYALGGGNDLKEAIGNILNANPDKRLFLLGDQFEELFTICTDERQREDLGIALIDCAKEFKDRFRFFITIRSDFWTKLLEDAGFSSIVGDSGENKELGERFFLSPMTVDELRSAIEKPLAVAKLHIQDGLTDLILTSIAREPGSLPLLEFCLEELWRKQIDFTLNYNAYKEIGEVKGALATYAEQVYSRLTDSEKDALKKIMLQLVQPGKRTEDTKRIALVDDVIQFDYGQSQESSEQKIESADNIYSKNGFEMKAFINALAGKRLIVTGTNDSGKQTIELVHEALIHEWKQLREWINADREFRVWQEKIRYALEEWVSLGKKEDGLLHGTSRVTAEEWYRLRGNDLGEMEIEFIEKSIELKTGKERKMKVQRIIAFGPFTAAIFAIVLSGWALNQKIKADLIIEYARSARLDAFMDYKNASDLKLWSKYQGAMNWEEAKKKCASLEMRLPNREEWLVNFEENKEVLSKWSKEDHHIHWTSTEYSDDTAYYFDIYSAIFNTFVKNQDWHVRCIR